MLSLKSLQRAAAGGAHGQAFTVKLNRLPPALLRLTPATSVYEQEQPHITKAHQAEVMQPVDDLSGRKGQAACLSREVLKGIFRSLTALTKNTLTSLTSRNAYKSK